MNKKKVPILFNRKEECCGCTACSIICPKNSIEMITDKKGFKYPKLDQEKCIGCCQCMSICPLKI